MRTGHLKNSLLTVQNFRRSSMIRIQILPDNRIRMDMVQHKKKFSPLHSLLHTEEKILPNHSQNSFLKYQCQTGESPMMDYQSWHSSKASCSRLLFLMDIVRFT